MESHQLEDLLRSAGEVDRLAAAGTPRRRIVGGLWPLGLAAACVLAALMPQVLSRPAIRPGAPAARSTPRRTHIVLPRDAAAVVALFRTWSEECDCPAWTMYDWDREAHADPSVKLIELSAAADAPVPIDPAIVLAIAPDARDLPRTDAQKRELLRCLDGGSLLVGDDVSCYPQIVRSCLPETVTVVARPVGLH